MIWQIKFVDFTTEILWKTTENQCIDYREFLTDYPRCRSIIRILLCATEQLKATDQLSTWFSHVKKTVSKHGMHMYCAK